MGQVIIVFFGHGSVNGKSIRIAIHS